MVIVTKRCFIYAESIRYVTIHEDRDYEAQDRERALFERIFKKHDYECIKPITKYTIIVHYIPSNSKDQTDSCEVYTYSKEIAEKIFADIVHQYREQNPDAVYLDKIAEKFLGETND